MSVKNIILILIYFVTTAYAETPKKGRVLCEGDKCKAIVVPIGSLVNRESEFLPEKEIKIIPIQKISAVNKKKKVQVVHSESLGVVNKPDSNLPTYYDGIDRSGIESSEKVVFVPKSNDPKLKGLKSGDIIWAVVEQEITASPEVPTPIRAIATTGLFKGSYFVGEAKLDRELKRILFNFNKLRIRNNDSVYNLKAAGLSPLGSIGLEGKYVSHTGKFFIAELASAAAAGFVDSTINRNQTTLGTYVQEPSMANSGKSAAVAALSKTTERMADAIRSAPEYTHIEGYQEIQIIVQEDPVESN